jgi:hypothetical protein
VTEQTKAYGPPKAAVIERYECARCHAEVGKDKTRHFCGEPYPRKACDEIVVTRYFRLRDVIDRIEALAGELDNPIASESIRYVAYVLEREWASAR